MSSCKFDNVKMCGIKAVVPEHYIDIDDELQYFNDNPKKVARAKKMIGYGRRYIADENTTVVDMAVDAAEKLLDEMKINKTEIDLLIFVNQKPDFQEPCDACVAHGRLGLGKNCTTLDINLGCSGYAHALMTAHAYLSSGAFKTCLLLAGDLCGKYTDQKNRKAAPVFGDAASATILKHTNETRTATFVTGTDGSGWNKIIHPFGGARLPYDEKTVSLKVENAVGDKIGLNQGVMKGEDVFNFTMEVAPQLILDTLEAANLTKEDIDLYAIHQANKQIVENIISKAGIPAEKAPIETFSKYANNSTNSVVTVLCDQGIGKDLNQVMLTAFGIGLSWGSCILNISDLYNGGISTYISPKDYPTREEQINYWIRYYKGEE